MTHPEVDRPFSDADWKDSTASSWFVPPLVVPAFLVALIVARVAYQFFA
jgi:hypothetical protein